MRELLGVFAGNEMVLGILLGLWLLLMGCGTAAGSCAQHPRKARTVFSGILIALAVLPLAQICVIRGLRLLAGHPGVAMGLNETVAVSLALLAPYCLLAGFGLSVACSALKATAGALATAKVYLADSFGSALAALSFTFLFTRFWDHISILIVPALLSLLAASLLAWQLPSRFLLCTAVALCPGVVAVNCLLDLDGVSTTWQHPGQQVLFRANSPYGRLVVTKASSQLNVLQNEVLLTSTPDDQHVEETVHYAMSQRPQAARVLLVGGGISGATTEILKYPCSRVDHVELDPAILQLGRQFVPRNLPGERVRSITGDGRFFLASTKSNYDVILLDVPAPSTAQFNRFYTREFLAQARRALAPEGVLSFSVGQYENYVSSTLARQVSSAALSAQSCFRNSLIVPGNRIFVLASDGPLFTNIAERIENARVRTKLVNRHYLEAMLAPDRLQDMARASSQPAALNRDFAPVLYFYHLRHWMSQFNLAVGPIQIVLGLALLFYVGRTRGNALLIFSAGFASSSLEFVLLLALQLLCGSIYHQMGLLLALFMAGLALGGCLGVRFGNFSPTQIQAVKTEVHPIKRFSFLWLHSRCRRPGALRVLAFVIALYSIALPFLLPGLEHLGGRMAGALLIRATLGILTLLLAGLVGLQFTLTVRKESLGASSPASRLFTADFIGACLGALLASTLIVPLFGVTALCLLNAGLNGLAGAAGGFRKSLV